MPTKHHQFRKRQATEDISAMIENIEKVLHNRRMSEIYKVMESRSRRRVLAGDCATKSCV
jgi:hypothetical protein